MGDDRLLARARICRGVVPFLERLLAAPVPFLALRLPAFLRGGALAGYARRAAARLFSRTARLLPLQATGSRLPH